MKYLLLIIGLSLFIAAFHFNIKYGNLIREAIYKASLKSKPVNVTDEMIRLKNRGLICIILALACFAIFNFI